MKESNLYPIIKTYLDTLGFEVKAEVGDVDIMAVKNETLLLVEMKQTLNITLIYQGIQRQKLSDYVYIAIGKPTDKVLQSQTFKEKKVIIKRLGLGLMVVDSELKHVSVLLDPTLPKLYKDHKKRKRLNEEFLLRKNTINTGGVTRTKIITAYRELAISIITYLADGKKTVQEILNYTNQLKSTRVLIDNYYGWFIRVSRGVYTLSEAGRKALVTYEDIIDLLNE